jgi:hypothetical protein
VRAADGDRGLLGGDGRRLAEPPQALPEDKPRADLAGFSRRLRAQVTRVASAHVFAPTDSDEYCPYGTA